jgi:hypothetical protein
MLQTVPLKSASHRAGFPEPNRYSIHNEHEAYSMTAIVCLKRLATNTEGINDHARAGPVYIYIGNPLLLS